LGYGAGKGMTGGPHLSSTAGAGGGGAGWRRRLAGPAGAGAVLDWATVRKKKTARAARWAVAVACWAKRKRAAAG
jgi:hypothetical protein